MHVDQEKLKAENTTLAGALREKTKKHQATQEQLDRLKRKEMTAATQHAAFDSVDEVLQSASSRHAASDGQYRRSNQGTGSQGVGNAAYALSGHHRHGSNGSGGHAGMMPPPLPRSGPPFAGQGLRHGEYRGCRFKSSGDEMSAPESATPSHSRSSLGSAVAASLGPGSVRGSGPFSLGSHNQTPSFRRPLSNVSSNMLGRMGGGYGLTAGMRKGSQQSYEGFSGYR